MDRNNATILALSLGIPCATVLSIACLLTFRITHRQLLARRIRNPTVPTNSPAPPSPPPVDPYYGIPLEQRPPRILAPLPRRPIPLNEYDRAARSEESGNSESTHSTIPLPRPPAPPRRRAPVIILSPTVTTEDPPHASRSPSPGEYAHRDNRRRCDMGRDIRVTAPPTHDHTRDAILQHPQPLLAPTSSGIMSPSPSAPTSLPQSQPPHSIEERPMSGIDQPQPGSRHSSLYETRNPSPVAQPSQFQTTAATGRTSSSSDSRGIDPDYTVDVGDVSTDNSPAEPRPPPELLAPPESRYYEYFTSETSGEGTLQEIPRPPTPFRHTTPYADGRSTSGTPSESTLHPRTTTRDGSD